MKMLVSLALLALLVLQINATLPGNNIRVAYIDSVTDWWGGEKIAAGMAIPGYANKHEYTHINLAFILHTGVADALNLWANPFGYMDQYNNPFGNSVEAVRQSWLNSYHSAGVKVLVSAFGATEMPTSQGYDPTSYCTDLAWFVKNNNLDGIDLDYEDNDAMNRGTGEDWVIRCTRAIRNVLPSGQYLLTHAPQAPYFAGKPIYPNGGYLTIHQQVGDLIDFYNIQFYNQGDNSYDSYEKLFTNSGAYFQRTSVKEMIDAGIPREKIVIGKPITQGDAANTGLVSAIDLHNWAQRASDEFGWSTGIMTWQYPSDHQGQFVRTYLHGY